MMVKLGVTPIVGDETVFKLKADNIVMLQELTFLRNQVAELEADAKGVIKAIQQHGLTLLKTSHGFEVRKLGKAEAYEVEKQNDN